MSALTLRTDGGALFVADGRLVATAVSGAEALDARGAMVEPGAVNAHTHLYSGLAPYGLPAPAPTPQNFLQILERVWWRLDRALDPASLRASARLYVGEALLAGCTALVDHHESPGTLEGSLTLLAEEATSLGIRLATGYGATERNGGRDEAERGLAECVRFARTAPSGVKPLVALHASFTVSDDTIRQAGRLARELGTVVHVHVAEDVADVDDAKRRGFEGPLERLLSLDGLPPGSILAHGVHLPAASVRRAAEAGHWLVQNPRSNVGNRVGYPAALSESPLVALGTDGYPAHMFEEAAALRVEAGRHADAGWQARLQGGFALAGALFGVRLGELAPGAAADLVVREPDGAVRHVLVGGRVVVRDGRLVPASIDGLRAEARLAAAPLWERMKLL